MAFWQEVIIVPMEHIAMEELHPHRIAVQDFTA